MSTQRVLLRPTQKAARVPDTRIASIQSRAPSTQLYDRGESGGGARGGVRAAAHLRHSGPGTLSRAAAAPPHGSSAQRRVAGACHRAGSGGSAAPPPVEY